MRVFLGLFIAAFLSTASASYELFPRAAGYPSCAVSCLSQGASMSKCGAGETSCYCKDPVFVNFTTSCINQNCTNPDDVKQADQTAEEACAKAGAPLPSAASTGSSPSATASKSNNAESIVVNMIGVAAALGAAALAL